MNKNISIFEELNPRKVISGSKKLESSYISRLPNNSHDLSYDRNPFE
jgi:hypothetical protein